MSFQLILPYLRAIQHLILDPEISEVMVNGPEHVFIERQGRIIEVREIKLDEKHIYVALKHIARLLHDDISETKPTLDARLPDGSRVAGIVAPVAVNGPYLTIRKFQKRWFNLNQLVENCTISPEMKTLLASAVTSRKNILISGGTGTGKTTILNALANEILPEERIVLIEETSEIDIEKPDIVRMEARPALGARQAVTIRDLVRASLRHRPDRIIIGEVRGEEAFDLLQALNTGHTGSISTIHANSASEALARFTTCVLMSKVEIPYKALRAMMGDSVSLIVQMERRAHERRVVEIIEVRGYDFESDKFRIEQIDKLASASVLH